MRSVMLKTAMLGAAVLLVSGTARAEDLLDVNVPFAFSVNHETFPAGRYQLSQDPLTGPSVMILRNMNTSQAAIIATHEAGGRGPSQPALEFRHRENQYQLSNIWESPREGQTIIQYK